MKIIGHYHRFDAAAFVRESAHQRGAVFARIRISRIAVTNVNERTVKFFEKPHIDHAGDRVAAIDRRGCVEQNIDLPDGSQRDGVKIDERRNAGLRERVGGEAAAVLQHECRVRREAAQSDRGCAR